MGRRESNCVSRTGNGDWTLRRAVYHANYGAQSRGPLGRPDNLTGIFDLLIIYTETKMNEPDDPPSSRSTAPISSYLD